MQQKIDPKIIRNFLSNESSAEEAELVYQYLNDHPEELDYYFDIEEWKNAKEGLLSYERMTFMKKRIRKANDNRDSTVQSSFLKYAAILVLIVISIFFVRLLIKREENTSYPIVIQARQIIENLNNVNKDTLLPDGSLVRLAPQSRLSYTRNYVRSRVVEVEEGLVRFEEKKIKNIPFVVIAQNIATTPIGTRFWVHNDSRKKEVEVVMEEGQVKIKSIDTLRFMRELVLKKKEKVLINCETMVMSLFRAKTKVLPTTLKQNNSTIISNMTNTIWTNNKIQFNQVKLSTVFDKIASRYNKEIVYKAEQIKNYHFTGEVYYDDDVEKLIKNICEVNGLYYSVKGDSLLIEKKLN